MTFFVFSCMAPLLLICESAVTASAVITWYRRNIPTDNRPRIPEKVSPPPPPPPPPPAEGCVHFLSLPPPHLPCHSSEIDNCPSPPPLPPVRLMMIPRRYPVKKSPAAFLQTRKEEEATYRPSSFLPSSAIYLDGSSDASSPPLLLSLSSAKCPLVFFFLLAPKVRFHFGVGTSNPGQPSVPSFEFLFMALRMHDRNSTERKGDKCPVWESGVVVVGRKEGRDFPPVEIIASPDDASSFFLFSFFFACSLGKRQRQ